MIPVKMVRVGPFNIAIGQLDGEDRDNCFGVFSDTEQTIKLRKEFATVQLEAETLLHELMHAVYRAQGIKSKDAEERIISQLSIGLAAVMRDNQKLFEYFLASFK